MKTIIFILLGFIFISFNGNAQRPDFWGTFTILSPDRGDTLSMNWSDSSMTFTLKGVNQFIIDADTIVNRGRIIADTVQFLDGSVQWSAFTEADAGNQIGDTADILRAEIGNAYYPDLTEFTTVGGGGSYYGFSFGVDGDELTSWQVLTNDYVNDNDYYIKVGQSNFILTATDNTGQNLTSIDFSPSADALAISSKAMGSNTVIELGQQNGIKITDGDGYGLWGNSDYSANYSANSYIQWGATQALINDSLQRINDSFFKLTDQTRSFVTNAGADSIIGVSGGKLVSDPILNIEDSIPAWVGIEISDSLKRFNDSLAAHLAFLQAHADSIDNLRTDIGSGGGGDGINWLVATNSTTGKGVVDTVFQFDLDTNTYHLEMDTATTIDWTGGSQGDRYIFMLYQDAVGGRELYFMPGKWQAEHGILNISTGSNDTNVVSGYNTGSKVILSIIQNAEGL